MFRLFKNKDREARAERTDKKIRVVETHCHCFDSKCPNTKYKEEIEEIEEDEDDDDEEDEEDEEEYLLDQIREELNAASSRLDELEEAVDCINVNIERGNSFKKVLRIAVLPILFVGLILIGQHKPLSTIVPT